MIVDQIVRMQGPTNGSGQRLAPAATIGWTSCIGAARSSILTSLTSSRSVLQRSDTVLSLQCTAILYSPSFRESMSEQGLRHERGRYLKVDDFGIKVALKLQGEIVDIVNAHTGGMHSTRKDVLPVCRCLDVVTR
jgi:hypothetical protein